MHEGLLYAATYKSYRTLEKTQDDTEKRRSICQCICDFFRCLFCCCCCGSTTQKTTEKKIFKEDPPTKNRNGKFTEDYDELVNRFKDLTGELEMLRERNEQERRSKEEALTRLSSIAGTKLMHNNPGITDLSDQNRPTKLAERFSELYDNEWTEAFEREEKEGLYQEKEIIAKLLNILKDVFERCRSLAEHQRTRLQEAVSLSDTIPSNDTRDDNVYVLKKIKDLQKQTSGFVMDGLIQELHFGDLRGKYEFEFRECWNYVDNCIKLCWLMNIQDPPVFLHFDVDRLQPVDEQYYKFYTISGQVVDFLVWPAVLLYEGGSLLSRGVVQPMEKFDFSEPWQVVDPK